MLRTFLLILLLVLIASFPFVSEWYNKHRSGISMNNPEIEKVIEDYLDKNPQKIIESVSKYQKQQFEEQQKTRLEHFKSLFKENKEKILDFNYPSIKSNENAITVVEFFDSSCGYCKRVQSELQAVMDNNTNINYIFRNLPILGEPSMLAAKYEIAVYMFAKEKNLNNPSEIYKEFYKRTLTYNEKYDEEILLSFVSEVGIDREKFKLFLKENDEKITQMIDETKKLAKDISIYGTPAFIVGDQLLPGAVDQVRLEQAIKDASTH
jgi:protein-disulfide isomerase